MNIAKSTYELLEPIIQAIKKTIVIDSVVNNGGGSYTLNVCNTLWATQGFPLTIQGNSYVITAVVPNVSITVKGLVVPVSGTFDLYAPKFYHGSISVVEGELNQSVNSNKLSIDKMPMIWLHEPVDEENDPNTENAIVRKSRCELYFLIDANFAQWTQDDHYKQAIKPMRQLIMAFFEALKNSSAVEYDLIGLFPTMDLPRFGRYTAYSGAKKAIFAQYEMSGTKLTITIPFIRNNENCC